MKKIIMVLLVALLLATMALPAFSADYPLLVDKADLLTNDEEKKKKKKLNEVSDELNTDVVIVSTNDIEGKSIMAYADDTFDNYGYGIGRKGDRSGVILVIYDNGSGSTTRWISTSGNCIKAFSDDDIQKIGSQLAPIMDEGRWQEACTKFVDLSYEQIKKANSISPMGVVVSLVGGVVIAFIIMSIIKKKYKPVQFKANAADYLVNGSLNVTGAYEQFRTTSVTKTAIQSNSGGSSTHTSSSGRTHGGGGF